MPGPGLLPAGASLGLWKQQRDPFPPFTSPPVAKLFEQSESPGKTFESSNASADSSEMSASLYEKDFEMDFEEDLIEQDDVDDADQKSQQVLQRLWYDPVRRK